MTAATKAEQIIHHLKTDKTRAVQVHEALTDQLRAGSIDPVHLDITGAPRDVLRFRQYKQQEQAAVFEARESMFFRKIEVDVDKRGGGAEHRVYLLTKGRVSTGVTHDDWLLVSWTAPITEIIRDAQIGKTVEWKHPVRPKSEIMKVRARGVFDGTLLPRITDATYHIGGRAIYIKDDLAYFRDQAPVEGAIEAAPDSKPPQAYEAARDFGLHEIIQQADPKQWRALHLPFRDTVLVEGPPGSGKTSIGLMRVPCLIDRQWEELQLRPDRDEAFHSPSTMVVLVMNDEMIDYLAKLIRTVGVQGLPVRTMEDFCRDFCRDGGTLGGRTVNELPLLSAIKHHPLAFAAIWAGLRGSLDNLRRSELKAILGRISPSRHVRCAELVRDLEVWTNRLVQTEVPSPQSPAPSLAEIIRRWQQQSTATPFDLGQSSKDEEVRREELEQVKEEVAKFGKIVFNRSRIVEAMLRTQEFNALIAAVGVPSHHEVIEEWRQQTTGEVQHITEGDLLLHARLAVHLTLLPNLVDRLPFGGPLPNFTHIMIDEAQDIAPGHISLIKSLLHPDGTLTLVGDLRQRVVHHGYFQDWSDLETGKRTNAIFKVNHRQSKPLGTFVSKLHGRIFGTQPDWLPSDRRDAPKPRIRPKRGFVGLSRVVAEEVRHWREQIPGATVGILYHGQRWNQATKFASRIEDALGDTLTKVRVATASDGSQLGRLNCAIIASVETTKGLEFDAVVFIDRHQNWAGRLDALNDICRNALYVATSRAKQGLSLIVDDRSELLLDEFANDIADVLPVSRPVRVDSDEDDDFDD